MSAPDTNVEKQVERHKFPLLGMAAVAVLVGALLLGLTAWLSANGDTPEEVGAQIEVVPGADATVEANV